VESRRTERLVSLAPGFVATFEAFSVETLVAKVCGGGLAQSPAALTHRDNRLAGISPPPFDHTNGRRALCRAYKMTYEGMKDETDRRDLIAYLKQQARQ
jgi:hypothetical protein